MQFIVQNTVFLNIVGFHFQEDRTDVLLFISSTKQNENSGELYIKKHKKMLKGRKKKAEDRKSDT